MPADASEDDIKRAFRRLALQLHPDKQKNDDAAETEAAADRFKEVNAAYSLLSDPKKRAKFDRTGTLSDDDEEDEIELSPTELVNMAFGTTTMRHYNGAGEPQAFAFAQLVPALLLAVATFAPPRSAPAEYADAAAPFRLHADGAYATPRVTPGAGVPYFVRDDFESALLARYPSALRVVEGAVDSIARTRLREACDTQRRQRQRGIDEARRRPKGPERDALVAAAEARAVEACDELSSAFGEARASTLAFRRERPPKLPAAIAVAAAA